jgi:hypothetical protein
VSVSRFEMNKPCFIAFTAAVVVSLSTACAGFGAEPRWGKATNCISVGIGSSVVIAQQVGKHDLRLDVTVHCHRAGSVNGLFLPKPEQRFSVEVFDMNGHAVEKTTLGRRRSEALGTKEFAKQKAKGIIKRLVLAEDAKLKLLDEIYVRQWFDIKTPGEYKLKLKLNLFEIESTVAGATRPNEFVLEAPDITVVFD